MILNELVFETYFDEFKKSKYWQSLLTTVENSPYHREDNVAMHTELVIAAIKAEPAYQLLSDREKFMALLCGLFHDIGKPEAESVKESESRGVYRSYINHEVLSSRFMDYLFYANESQSLSLKRFGLSVDEYFAVLWCVEHHLWYKISKKDLALAFKRNELIKKLYLLLILGDNKGRIQDKREEELKTLNDALVEINSLVDSMPDNLKRLKKRVYMLLGISCSGKSTLIENLVDALVADGALLSEIGIVNGDSARVDFFKENADRNLVEKAELNDRLNSEAYKFYRENKDAFMAYFSKICENIYNSHKHVISDFMHLNRFHRVHTVKSAKKHNFGIVCIYLPINPNLALLRAKARIGHDTSSSILKNFEGLSMPMYGSEMDDLLVLSQNL